jgi:hypothetical protein
MRFAISLEKCLGWKGKTCIQTSGNVEGGGGEKRGHLEDPDVDGRIALTRLLRNQVVRMVVNGNGS